MCGFICLTQATDNDCIENVDVSLRDEYEIHFMILSATCLMWFTRILTKDGHGVQVTEFLQLTDFVAEMETEHAISTDMDSLRHRPGPTPATVKPIYHNTGDDSHLPIALTSSATSKKPNLIVPARFLASEM